MFIYLSIFLVILIYYAHYLYFYTFFALNHVKILSISYTRHEIPAICFCIVCFLLFVINHLFSLSMISFPERFIYLFFFLPESLYLLEHYTGNYVCLKY